APRAFDNLPLVALGDCLAVKRATHGARARLGGFGPAGCGHVSGCSRIHASTRTVRIVFGFCMSFYSRQKRDAKAITAEPQRALRKSGLFRVGRSVVQSVKWQSSLWEIAKARYRKRETLPTNRNGQKTCA